jgi:anaerobic selenocysteine-containing dehydrogenase
VAARERKWNTRSGRANFHTAPQMFAGDVTSYKDEGVFQLMTLRSNDQFNTTVYDYNDRFRGVSGTREVVFANAADIAAMGLSAGAKVDLETVSSDGRLRAVRGFMLVALDMPRGSLGAYFPEANPLVPLAHHDTKALTPGYKAIPVRMSAHRL